MKTQVVVIHGGNAFENKDEYIQHLKTKSFALDRLRISDWKSNLSKNLGDNFDVLLLEMPNKQDARYSEWKIWFERIIPLLDEKVILIGHSLGGIFLAKYLSENTYAKKVIATLLVAAPYNTPTNHPLVDFNLLDMDNYMLNFDKQVGKILIYQSKDDVVVPYSNCEDYKKHLPSAELKTFENRGHFNQPEFPELVKDIKNLVK